LAALVASCLASLPTAAQTTRIQKEVNERLAAERLRQAADAQTRDLYEDIEIMGRLLDRGLVRHTRAGRDAGLVGNVAFSPDGRLLAVGSGSGVRIWDANTGKNLSGHPTADLTEAQGVYLKGQGVVYTLTMPLHHQKPVGGPDKPPAKALTEWERVRRELRGEHVEADKPREPADSSIADAVLRVLADNGKNLTHLPEGESVTVAITLLPVQACTKCHESISRGGPGMGGRGPAGGMGSNPGMMAPGGGGMRPGGGGSGFPGGPGAQPGTSGSSSTSGPPGLGSSSSGSPGVGAGPDTEAASLRAEFRKHALLGDLAMKQQDYAQAVQAFRRASSMYTKPPADAADLLEVIEVGTKLARALLAQGKLQEAEAVVKGVAKLSDQLAGSQPGFKPAPDKPVAALPAKLIISLPKKLLDQAGTGKMTTEEFQKLASVEYLMFDKPASN
jgi:hypothetical protein